MSVDDNGLIIDVRYNANNNDNNAKIVARTLKGGAKKKDRGNLGKHGQDMGNLGQHEQDRGNLVVCVLYMFFDL